MARKILFLTLNPPKGSTKQRLMDSLPYLVEKGMECTVKPVPNALPGRLAMILSAGRYDAVYIQKKLLRPFEIRTMRRLNPNIVYDVDDSVMFHELQRSERITGRYFVRYMATLDNCKTVLAGNRFLQDISRYNNDNVVLVPTPVNVSQYTPKDYSAKPERDGIVIGWMGMRNNLKYMHIIGPALGILSKKYPGLRFKILSRGFIDIDGVEVIKKYWEEEEYVSELADMDIGVMPLDDDLWTHGVCANKILQYWGVGIPAVASPVGANLDVVEDGVDGFFASTTDEWVDRLSILVEDRELRRRMGLAGREKALERYSQEIHSETLYRVLSGL